MARVGLRSAAASRRRRVQPIPSGGRRAPRPDWLAGQPAGLEGRGDSRRAGGAHAVPAEAPGGAHWLGVRGQVAPGGAGGVPAPGPRAVAGGANRVGADGGDATKFSIGDRSHDEQAEPSDRRGGVSR
eukprot:138396-Prorocentrum_minimum.AAC.1